MKIKNYEAINTYAKLGEILKNYSFKARVCQSIVKNKNKLKEIMDNFEEARQTLVKSLADKDENGEPLVEGNNYVINDREKLNREFVELQEIETEIEFDKISVDDLAEMIAKLSPEDKEALKAKLEEKEAGSEEAVEETKEEEVQE